MSTGPRLVPWAGCGGAWVYDIWGPSSQLAYFLLIYSMEEAAAHSFRHCGTQAGIPGTLRHDVEQERVT